MNYLFRRFTSLGSLQVFERRVLLDFAALRNGLVAIGSGLLLDWQADAFGALIATALVPCNAALIALISADWIEHYGRILALGYPFNPNVSAIGELENSMCPQSAEYIAEWERRKYEPFAFWHGDPGSGHYPYPIPTFWGRVKACWTGI